VRIPTLNLRTVELHVHSPWAWDNLRMVVARTFLRLAKFVAPRSRGDGRNIRKQCTYLVTTSIQDRRNQKCRGTQADTQPQQART